MINRVLANLVVGFHFVFILFAVLGGFLVLRWKRCAWIHLPIVLWSVLIELVGWVCPLTPLENWLRGKGGEVAYENGFIEHYILPIIYPTALTPNVQIVLGIMVLGVNLGIYTWVLRRIMKIMPI